MVILPEGLFEIATVEIDTANNIKELKEDIKNHSDIPVEYQELSTETQKNCADSCIIDKICTGDFKHIFLTITTAMRANVTNK